MSSHPSSADAPDDPLVPEPTPVADERLSLLVAFVVGIASGTRGLAEAIVSQAAVQKIFANLDERYPPLMTYAQTADLVQVAESTLKGWFSEGRYAGCVKRGKPARVIRDLFVKEFLKDRFGVNAE